MDYPLKNVQDHEVNHERKGNLGGFFMYQIGLQQSVFVRILEELTQIKELLCKIYDAKISISYETVHRQSQSRSSVSPEAPQSSDRATCPSQERS